MLLTFNGSLKDVFNYSPANLIHCFVAENAFLKVDWVSISELKCNQSCTLHTGTSSKEIDKVAGDLRSCFFFLKGQSSPALLLSPQMAGFSCGGEACVHLKDEKTCAFKRAVSPFPHAPPQPRRHSSCEHLWGSSCPLCLFVGNRTGFPEHHWRQGRAQGRTPLGADLHATPGLNYCGCWDEQRERRLRPTPSGVRTPRDPKQGGGTYQLDKPRGEFRVKGDSFSRSKINSDGRDGERKRWSLDLSF